jgi:hypothetical protein
MPAGGRVPAAEAGPMHVHQGDEVLRVLSGQKQPALASQLQPARLGPLGKLAQQLLISRRQLRPAWSRSSVTSVIWCLLRLGGYTVEITVPAGPRT